MHVVVFHIDALQPAYIGAYGCDWVDTPALDALAARGVVFDQHFANDLVDAGDEPDQVTRIELNTLSPPWKLTAKDLANFFSDETEEGDEPIEPWLEPLPAKIDEDDDETFARLQGTYAAAIRKTDAKLGKLLEKHADAIVIVTSGRGIAMGEHGNVGFAESLHEEMVHLPLIMAWPDGRHAGRRVAALTQPFDLAPTIAELLGETWTPQGDPITHGRSLLPLVESPLATIRPNALIRNGPAVGIRNRDWYYLRDAARLYVKPDDRWEVNDVYRQHPAVCEEMESLLAKITPEAK